MSDNVLILVPRDALHAPKDPSAFVRWLETVGLTGAGQPGRGDLPKGPRYTCRTGPAFEKLIAFGEPTLPISGSAVKGNAVLHDVADGPQSIDRSTFIRDVCQVVVVGPLEREWFIASASTEDPRCNACGSRAEWDRIAAEWYATWTLPNRTSQPEVTCSACGVRGAPWAFDWRGTAAFARFYIELWHIREGQAIPSQALMDGLATATGTPWSFVHYHL